MSTRDRSVRTAGIMLWSVVVWVALWSELSVANVIWGLVVGAATTVLVPPHGGPRTVAVRPLPLLRLVGHFLWALVRASAVVAWEVVTPRNRIHQGIVAAPLQATSPGVITLIANIISLTPGTLTLEVRTDPPVLYVHIMHLRTVEEVRGDIQRLEALVLRAFPSITATAEEPS